MRSTRRIELPLYLAVLLLAALALNLVRGFDLARRRSADLQPASASKVLDLRVSPDTAAPLMVDAEERFLIAHLERRAGARLALHQVFPERDVLRWMEKQPGRDEWLVVPLAGLPAGEYAFRWAAPEERAEAVDPDWQMPAREWLGRFELGED